MQKEKLTRSLFGQSQLLGRWWGNIQTIAQNTNIYIQFLILSFSATSAYAVLAETLHQWGYQLPFWLFVLGVVFSIFMLGLFVWRLSIPSTFASWNYLWWNNGNHIRPVVEKLVQDNNDLKKELKEIKNLMEKLCEQKNLSVSLPKEQSLIRH